MPRAKFAKMSVEELKRELLRRQRTLPQLIARKEALAKQITELLALGEVQAAPKRLGRKPEKKRVRKTQGRMRAGCPAGKSAALFQGKKSPSPAESIGAGDKDRFHAALGAEKDGQAPALSDENGKERAGPSTDQAGSTPRLAERNVKGCAVLHVVQSGSKLRLADEDDTVVWSPS
jgi:hypothetical protein